MSVITSADEANDSLRKHLKQSIKECNTLLDSETWGHSDFKKEYLLKINELRKLLQDKIIDLN